MMRCRDYAPTSRALACCLADGHDGDHCGHFSAKVDSQGEPGTIVVGNGHQRMVCTRQSGGTVYTSSGAQRS